MSRTYGIGYQGSKSRIAKYIIDILPPGNRLVDLFAGGCSITHCAMLSGKYKKFLANDIDVRMPQTFKDAPDDFVCVWSKPICKKFAGGKSSSNKAIEKLFIHKRFAQ